LRNATGVLAFRDVLHPSCPLAGIVEGIADWDIPDGDQARALSVNVFPTTASYLMVQYRTSIGSIQKFGGLSVEHKEYRHVATQVKTGVITMRPRGPLGAVILRLKPEAAARLLGDRLEDFADVKVDLGDVFKPGEMSLLEEMVSEAPNSVQRVACVLHFLAAKLRERELDPMVCRAAAVLRRRPSSRVRQLAAELGVSERHLSRRFQGMFGTSPKQFARIARIEKVVAARKCGSAWADVAYDCGFADQAHMINDFNSIIGASPEQVLGLPPIEQRPEGVVAPGGFSRNFLFW
jgi:AraC-like DNA-binding protein